MKNPLKDFLTWLLKPLPDTTLVNWWKGKREKAEEERRESIKTEAYLLWEADGKQEGKDDYYWTKACEKITGKTKAPNK